MYKKNQWIYKENLLKEIETEEVQFALVKDFLSELKREFGGEYDESAKVSELKIVEQREKTIENLFKSSKEQLEKVNMREEH